MIVVHCSKYRQIKSKREARGPSDVRAGRGAREWREARECGEKRTFIYTDSEEIRTTSYIRFTQLWSTRNVHST